ncbi:MAG TPA: SH3 domain-containing protein [Amycolatopsis sp.]|nr:SH3 domain-containing protein [Amycolatopsis sp.]
MILGIPKKVFITIVVLAGIALVYAMGTDKQNSPGAGTTSSTASSSTGCRVTVTADVLNVRAAPDPASEIVGKYNQNAETSAETVVQNGFRKLGDNRWAKTDFLQPVAGTNCG